MAPRAEASVDTIRGVVHISNPREGQWSPEDQWQVREVLRIGSVEERPNEFFTNGVMTPLLGPDGNIYVLEFSNPRVMVFDGSGSFVRQISREGQGPDELLNPTGIAWDGYDRLWIADIWGPVFKLFSLDGSFLESRPREPTLVRSQQHAVTTSPGGGVVIESIASPMLYMLRIDSATNATDTIARARLPERPRARSGGPAVRGSALTTALALFFPSIEWAVAPNGSHWVTKTDTIRLFNVNEAGDTLRIVETSHRPNTLTDEEETLLSEAVAESVLSREELGFSKEIVFGVHVLSDGHILVEVDETQDGSTVFDVFDPEGIYLGILDLGFRIATNSVFTTKGDTLLAVTTDSLDVPYVVRSILDRRR